MEKKMINKILAIVLVCGMLAGLLVPGSVPARAAETTTSTNLALQNDSVWRISNLTTNDIDNIQYVNDGDDSSGFWRKSMTSSACTDWIGFHWTEAVSVNQVVLKVVKAGNQAPLSWRVEVSKDGEQTWQQVASVSEMEWNAGEQKQSKILNFDLQENVNAIRICIDKINYAWDGYSINEIEVYNAKEPVVEVPETGNYGLIGTYISNVLNDINDIQNVNDGDVSKGFWRKNLSNVTTSSCTDWVGYKWSGTISINEVVLTVGKAQEQAPLSWRVEVSWDGGITWTEVASVSDVDWKTGNNIDPLATENKSLKFDVQKDINAVRICVDKVNCIWGGYSINEIEVYAPTIEQPESGNYVRVAKHETNLSLNDINDIEYANDGDVSKGFWRKNLSKVTTSSCTDWIGYKWSGTVSINEVVLTVGKAQEQAPISWRVEVSWDGGTTWKQVASVSDVDWKTSNNIDKTAIESKSLKFDVQRNINAMRICVDKVNCIWGGYAINEIEAFYNPVSLKGSTAALDGTIDMNFFFDLELSDAEKNSATTYASFSVPGVEEQKITVSSVGSPDPERGYEFTYQVPAKRMADTITIRFYVNGMPCPDTYEYSVAQYAKALVNGSGYTDTDKQMAAAMLHYGAYSQKYFNHNVENLADKDLPESYTFDIASVTAGSFTSLVSSNVKNLEGLGNILGSSLILESETTLRLYFKPAAGTAIDDFTFTRTDNGKSEVLNTVKTKIGDEDCICIDIPNIAAHELQDTLQLTVSNGSANGTLKYSTLTYGANVLKNTSAYNENLVNLVRALYLYSETARSYKGM